MSRCLAGQLGTMTGNRTRPGQQLDERAAPRVKIVDYDRVRELSGDCWTYESALSTVLHEFTNFTELWEAGHPKYHNRALRMEMWQRIREKYHWLADEAAFEASLRQ